MDANRARVKQMKALEKLLDAQNLTNQLLKELIIATTGRKPQASKKVEEKVSS